MRYHVLVALLAAVALSGCVADDVDPKEKNSELIDEARAQLGDDAALYGINGIEPEEEVPAEETDGCGTLPKAETPGNGKPPVWAYFYGSPATEEGLVIVIDEKGVILCEFEESMNLFPAKEPLESWSVTAVQAADTIAGNVDDYEDIVKDATVIMELTQEDNGPVWTFVVMSDTVYSAWSVDANNREFLGDLMETVAPAPVAETQAVVEPESGSADGTFSGAYLVVTTVTTMSTLAKFQLDRDGHQSLELVVESSDPFAQQGESFEVIVRDPEGNEESVTTTNGESITISNPAAGEFSVAAFPAVADVMASFTVEYCAYSDLHCSEPAAPPSGETAAGWLPWL